MEVAVRDRSVLASVAGWLLAGTIVIVVDVRFDAFDIVADLVGAAMALYGVLRLDAAVAGAEGRRTALVVLALIGLGAGALETFTINHPVSAWLSLAQVGGAFVLADVLADALETSEPQLARSWGSTHTVILWLGLVPLIGLAAIGIVVGPRTIETPLVILALLVAAIPLVMLLHSLYRTTVVAVEAPAEPA